MSERPTYHEPEFDRDEVRVLRVLCLALLLALAAFVVLVAL